MPYPENIVVRILICIVGMSILWVLGSFIATVLISHEEFTLRATHFIIPAVLGVVEALVWKRKD